MMEQDTPVRDRRDQLLNGWGAKMSSFYLRWQIWEESFQRVLKFCYNDLQSCLNLNAGTGKPCAGHGKLKLSFSFLIKRVNLESDENLGIDPLIGSEG